ncbi:putative Dynein light chain [Leptomonas pyrrhocoris]|uniref:Dynein light chain n=1 Tax=Leptomonas pyrrhocoris TaxID=157538 RepID=A0A0M9G5Q1_LEPPY|nr:putative Dynein light chain [Leptomonas pyrrhocoris]KPA82847.1 putative Dynein light chain [Leptomonas pyrrhocoris]|eukprot:XP_015661286.1 putative Dynein light chain [Leptomonas pyrrhocoris]
MSGTKVVMKESTMPVDMQQDCADCASHALVTLKLREQNSIAQFVKKELDVKYGGDWHCIVGHSFGTCVGHDTTYFLYFEIDGLYFNVWKMETATAVKQSDAAAVAAA